MSRFAIFIAFLLLVLATNVQCRIQTSMPAESTLISHATDSQSTSPSLDHKNVSDQKCKLFYGFLPCAYNVGGYIFQVVVFEFLLLFGDYISSEASKQLFDIFGIGIFGGIIFPLLIMLPRTSGLSASHEAAQSMVASLVGITAGCTVFSLTLQWGACVIFGRTDISHEDSNPPDEAGSIERSISGHLSYKKLLKSLHDSGTKVDPKSKRVAGIMLLSLIPFIMVQLSEIHSSSWGRGVVLTTLIVSILALVSYFAYQSCNKWDQRRSLAYIRLIKKFDKNDDGKIQIDELKNIIQESKLVRIHNLEEAAKKLMEEFDTNNDGAIDTNEFLEGVKKCFDEHRQATADSKDSKLIDAYHMMVVALLTEEKSDKSLTKKLLSADAIKASVQVIIGVVTVVFLGLPLMMNIQLLSRSIGIPSFFISFVMIPLVINIGQVLSASFLVHHKLEITASLKFSEIYGGVIMNNILTLSIILAIVYARGFTWDYPAEVLIVVVVSLVIGLFAVFRSTYPLWTCIVAISLYPFSLLLGYLLLYVFGWK